MLCRLSTRDATVAAELAGLYNTLWTVMAPEETARVIIRRLGYPWRTLHVGHVAFMTSVLWCLSDVRVLLVASRVPRTPSDYELPE